MMSSLARPILIVAGGTGGHIYPAIAVAEKLRELGITTVWLGSNNGMETRIVPSTGIRLVTIAVSGLRGTGIMRWVFSPFVLAFALAQALGAVIRIRPGVVLGMGGFASGPGGIAAWLCRAPLVVHEQNAIPGFTNGILSRIATSVFQAFPNAFPASRGALTVGNPVRKSIHAIAPPGDRDFTQEPVRILVVGGSRGARIFNEALPDVFERLNEPAIEIWHQCGDGNAALTEAAYGQQEINARVDEFIDDMAAAYAWASIVVCRSGALTVSEIANVGVGAILVPYPYAVDDHQTHNAKFLVDAGAAFLVAEGPDFASELSTRLQELCRDPTQFERLANNARLVAMPDAATLVAERCEELLHG